MHCTQLEYNERQLSDRNTCPSVVHHLACQSNKPADIGRESMRQLSIVPFCACAGRRLVDRSNTHTQHSLPHFCSSSVFVSFYFRCHAKRRIYILAFFAITFLAFDPLQPAAAAVNYLVSVKWMKSVRLHISTDSAALQLLENASHSLPRCTILDHGPPINMKLYNRLQRRRTIFFFFFFLSFYTLWFPLLPVGWSSSLIMSLWLRAHIHQYIPFCQWLRMRARTRYICSGQPSLAVLAAHRRTVRVDFFFAAHFFLCCSLLIYLLLIFIHLEKTQKTWWWCTFVCTYDDILLQFSSKLVATKAFVFGAVHSIRMRDENIIQNK